MGDALSAVERDVLANRAFFGHFTPSAIAATVLVWVTVFVSTVTVLSGLLGRIASRRFWCDVAYQAGVAAVLSVLGADFRRWWG